MLTIKKLREAISILSVFYDNPDVQWVNVASTASDQDCLCFPETDHPVPDYFVDKLNAIGFVGGVGGWSYEGN